MSKKTEESLSAANVRKLSDEEIGLELQRQREALYGLRAKSVTEKVEDTSERSKVRKGIARLATERTARRLAEAARSGKPSKSSKTAGAAESAKSVKPVKKTARAKA